MDMHTDVNLKPNGCELNRIQKCSMVSSNIDKMHKSEKEKSISMTPTALSENLANIHPLVGTTRNQ